MPADRKSVIRCLQGIEADLPTLQHLDNYLQGQHRDPYIPRMATDEYKLLAERCVTNMIPTLVNIPAQSLYVDGARSGVEGESVQVGRRVSASHWEHWQRSNLDGNQTAIHRAALAYGHAFTVTEVSVRRGGPITRGLSPMRTYALYADPANDIEPVCALTILRQPRDGQKGFAHFWDAAMRYDVQWDGAEYGRATIGGGVRHGASSCPVTRFAVSVDLEGRTIGVIEPMITLQDRINQTVMDILVAQSSAVHAVRWISGMAPPMKMKQVDSTEDDGSTSTEWVLDLDENGSPQPEPMRVGAADILFAESPETKFGSLQGTPLEGYIASVAQSMRHFTTMSQTPPHYLLGEIANLSAEALQAAETSLSRKINEIKTVFGESWERVFRLAGELGDEEIAAEDSRLEVLWRDMDAQAMSKVSDALVKLRELGIPPEGLWHRIPGATQQELEMWAAKAEQSPEQQFASAAERAAGFMSGGGDEQSQPPQQSAPTSAGDPRPRWSS